MHLDHVMVIMNEDKCKKTKLIYKLINLKR